MECLREYTYRSNPYQQTIGTRPLKQNQRDLKYRKQDCILPLTFASDWYHFYASLHQETHILLSGCKLGRTRELRALQGLTALMQIQLSKSRPSLKLIDWRESLVACSKQESQSDICIMRKRYFHLLHKLWAPKRGPWIHLVYFPCRRLSSRLWQGHLC